VIPKRLLLAVFLALAASIVVVPSAAAGNFDEEKMGCAGDNPATCPPGTVGQPYSLTIYLAPPDGGRGEDFDCATFHVGSGSFPPGLSVSSEGVLSGTPTQAGSYDFYLTVKYDKEPGCAKTPSDDRFIININPGIPKLTIGPESAPVGTVSAPYSLQMTSNLPDAKSWSIVNGALPPGLALNASTGLISGTPATAGSYPFTVQAAITPERTDTKALNIDVRTPVTLALPELPTQEGSNIRWEVGVPFTAKLTASGGTGTFAWSVANGGLPSGLTLGNDGSLAGRPTLAGTHPYSIAVTDTEGRRAVLSGQFIVSPRLAFGLRPAKAGTVGRRYSTRFLAAGGVAPVSWRVMFGPLPRGLRFNRTLGVVSGVPRRAGRYWVRLEIVDALGVKVGKNFLIRIAPAKLKRKR
jgi:large repetitive protein